MLKPQGEDLAFRLFVTNYVQQYRDKAEAEERAVTDVEIENMVDRLHEEYASGCLLLAKVESGMEEASKALSYSLHPDELAAEDLVEFSVNGELVIVPVWFKCYEPARATIEMYRAATGQPPL